MLTAHVIRAPSGSRAGACPREGSAADQAVLKGGEMRMTPSPRTKSMSIDRFDVLMISSYVSSSISTVVTVSSTSPRILTLGFNSFYDARIQFLAET